MITKLIYSYCARPDPSTKLRSKHPPGLRSFSEGRLEGFLRALQDILLPQFFNPTFTAFQLGTLIKTIRPLILSLSKDKPGSPSERIEDGVQQAQNERGIKLKARAFSSFYFLLCFFFKRRCRWRNFTYPGKHNIILLFFTQLPCRRCM